MPTLGTHSTRLSKRQGTGTLAGGVGASGTGLWEQCRPDPLPARPTHWALHTWTDGGR